MVTEIKEGLGSWPRNSTLDSLSRELIGNSRPSPIPGALKMADYEDADDFDGDDYQEVDEPDEMEEIEEGDGEGDGENVELIAAGEGGSGGGSGDGPRGAQRLTTPYMTKVTDLRREIQNVFSCSNVAY